MATTKTRGIKRIFNKRIKINGFVGGVDRLCFPHPSGQIPPGYGGQLLSTPSSIHLLISEISMGCPKFISMRSPVDNPFKSTWTSISHWHDTDLRHFGNDGNTAFDVLRMTTSTWEHNQRTVALFQHIDRILNSFCSRIFTVDRKCPTHTNHQPKIRLVKSSFFAIKINCFGLVAKAI